MQMNGSFDKMRESKIRMNSDTWRERKSSEMTSSFMARICETIVSVWLCMRVHTRV